MTTPRASALASALLSVTGQDWRWMETHDGAQYATLRLPCGAVVVVIAAPHASTEAVVEQACHALHPRRDTPSAE